MLLHSLSWAGFRQLKMIIFTTNFMCQPDVICGHFWKGSLCGGYKTHIFLWETGLWSVIRKTQEIDILLYSCSSDKIGLISHHLWRQRSIQKCPSSYLCFLSLFVLCQKQQTHKTHLVDGREMSISFPLYFDFFQRADLAFINCLCST